MMFPTHAIGRDVDGSDPALSVARTPTESVCLNGPTINGRIIRDLRGRSKVAPLAPEYRKFAVLFPWNRRGTGDPRRSHPTRPTPAQDDYRLQHPAPAIGAGHVTGPQYGPPQIGKLVDTPARRRSRSRSRHRRRRCARRSPDPEPRSRAPCPAAAPKCGQRRRARNAAFASRFTGSPRRAARRRPRRPGPCWHAIGTASHIPPRRPVHR